jgi:hypothetical protein
MAKLSAHGIEIGRIEYLTKRVAAFEDGKLLANYGDGWKLWKRVKDGADPRENFKRRVDNLRECEEACPAWAEYKRALHSDFSLSERSLVHTAVQMMPSDPDGCWVELQDMARIDCDIETLCKLCGLIERAQAEMKAYKARLAKAA